MFESYKLPQVILGRGLDFIKPINELQVKNGSPKHALRVIQGGSKPWQLVNKQVHPEISILPDTDDDLYLIGVTQADREFIKANLEDLGKACYEKHPKAKRPKGKEIGYYSFYDEEGDYTLTPEQHPWPVYCNFQIGLDHQSGKILYSDRFPSHAEKFESFINEGLIITHGLTDLIKEAEVLEAQVAKSDNEKLNLKLKVNTIAFVIKSLKKPLMIGKTFSFETALEIRDLILNKRIWPLIMKRLQSHYVFDPAVPEESKSFQDLAALEAFTAALFQQVDTLVRSAPGKIQAEKDEELSAMSDQLEEANDEQERLNKVIEKQKKEISLKDAEIHSLKNAVKNNKEELSKEKAKFHQLNEKAEHSNKSAQSQSNEIAKLKAELEEQRRLAQMYKEKSEITQSALDELNKEKIALIESEKKVQPVDHPNQSMMNPTEKLAVDSSDHRKRAQIFKLWNKYFEDYLKPEHNNEEPIKSRLKKFFAELKIKHPELTEVEILQAYLDCCHHYNRSPQHEHKVSLFHPLVSALSSLLDESYTHRMPLYSYHRRDVYIRTKIAVALREVKEDNILGLSDSELASESNVRQLLSNILGVAINRFKDEEDSGVIKTLIFSLSFISESYKGPATVFRANADKDYSRYTAYILHDLLVKDKFVKADSLTQDNWLQEYSKVLADRTKLLSKEESFVFPIYSNLTPYEYAHLLNKFMCSYFDSTRDLILIIDIFHKPMFNSLENRTFTAYVSHVFKQVEIIQSVVSNPFYIPDKNTRSKCRPRLDNFLEEFKIGSELGNEMIQLYEVTKNYSALLIRSKANEKNQPYQQDDLSKFYVTYACPSLLMYGVDKDDSVEINAREMAFPQSEADQKRSAEFVAAAKKLSLIPKIKSTCKDFWMSHYSSYREIRKRSKDSNNETRQQANKLLQEVLLHFKEKFPEVLISGEYLQAHFSLSDDLMGERKSEEVYIREFKFLAVLELAISPQIWDRANSVDLHAAAEIVRRENIFCMNELNNSPDMILLMLLLRFAHALLKESRRFARVRLAIDHIDTTNFSPTKAPLVISKNKTISTVLSLPQVNDKLKECFDGLITEGTTDITLRKGFKFHALYFAKAYELSKHLITDTASCLTVYSNHLVIFMGLEFGVSNDRYDREMIQPLCPMLSPEAIEETLLGKSPEEKNKTLDSYFKGNIDYLIENNIFALPEPYASDKGLHSKLIKLIIKEYESALKLAQGYKAAQKVVLYLKSYIDSKDDTSLESDSTPKPVSLSQFN